MSGSYKRGAHYTYTGAYTFLICTNVPSCYGTGGISGYRYLKGFKKRRGWMYGLGQTRHTTKGVGKYYKQTLRLSTSLWLRTSPGIAAMIKISIKKTTYIPTIHRAGGGTQDP